MLCYYVTQRFLHDYCLVFVYTQIVKQEKICYFDFEEKYVPKCQSLYVNLSIGFCYQTSIMHIGALSAFKTFFL